MDPLAEKSLSSSIVFLAHPYSSRPWASFGKSFDVASMAGKFVTQTPV